MILYFDNFITDEPLYKDLYLGLNKVRTSCEAYKMPDKLSIAMYTLASYAELDWSHVLIKYELQDKEKSAMFEGFVKRLFPHAVIVRGRSDSQKKFLESIKMMRGMGDEWVFYAGNVDHPFIAPETKTLNACLKMAEKIRKKYRFVSISYSHLPEALSPINKNSLMYCKKYRVLEENEDCAAVYDPDGNVSSGLIVNLDLFEHWFAKNDLGDKRIIRAESVQDIVNMKYEQVNVTPKREICAHFDGYSYAGLGIDDIAPPLFIPQGFFESKIKIAFGYPGYRKGWVNINPLMKKYSFRGEDGGTDLKICLDDIPLFWKKKIAKLDVNPGIDMGLAEAACKAEFEKRKNPWANNLLGRLTLTRARLGFYANSLKKYSQHPEILEKRLGYKTGHVMLRKFVYPLLKLGASIRRKAE